MQDAITDLCKKASAPADRVKPAMRFLHKQSVVVAVTADNTKTEPFIIPHRLVDIKKVAAGKSGFALCVVPFDSDAAPEIHVYATKSKKDATTVVDKLADIARTNASRFEHAMKGVATPGILELARSKHVRDVTIGTRVPHGLLFNSMMLRSTGIEIVALEGNSPHEASVHSGDHVMRLNGQSVFGMTTEAFEKLFKGMLQSGASVVLTLMSDVPGAAVQGAGNSVLARAVR